LLTPERPKINTSVLICISGINGDFRGLPHDYWPFNLFKIMSLSSLPIFQLGWDEAL
jgi:hypothetical protein